ncbi:MAG: hypothetical protein ACI8QZ_000995 [Chlamydiales bacterium]|jgi:hypothetical protein
MLLSTLVVAAISAPVLPTVRTGPGFETDSGLGNAAGLEACAADDLRALDDLRRVAAEVQGDLEQLRERSFDDPVTIGFANREWLDLAVRERWDEERSAERVALEELSAKMLGMLPAGVSLREEELRVLEQSGSFFDPQADQLFVLEPEGDVSPLLIAAGLSEALNDQHFEEEWGPVEEEVSDRRWTRQAVQRGSNIALLLLWAFENLEHAAVQEISQSQGGMSHSLLADSPPYVWKPMLGLSMRGEAFLRRGTNPNWISPPRLADLDRVVEQRPLSTEQILHPDKYWTGRRRDEPTPIQFEEQNLPEGWNLAYQDTLGEMMMSVLTEPFDDRHGVDPSLFSSPTAELSSASAAGWAGDRIALLQGVEGSIAHLVTAWDSPAEADEFFAAVYAQRAGIMDNLARVAGAVASRGMRVVQGAAGRVTVTTWMGPDEILVDSVLSGVKIGA